MKAYNKKESASFRPVILELETQDEVDSLYAVMNHTTICACVPMLRAMREQVDIFAVNWKPHHEKIRTILR